MDGDLLHREVQGPPACTPRLDQILHHLVLPVDGDGAAPRELRQIDPVPAAAEGEMNALVTHPLALQPRADAGVRQQIDGPLLQHAGADTLDDVVLAAVFQDDGVDALEMQQVPEHQPSGSRPDDPDLRARVHRALILSPSGMR
jgi:hypothetical protein